MPEMRHIGIDKDALCRAITGRGGSSVLSDEVLAGALSELTDGERFVIEHRFTSPFKTLKAIGEIFPRRDRLGRRTGEIGVTGERIMQIKDKAIRRLMHPVRLGKYLRF